MITDTGDTFCDHNGCGNYSDWVDGFAGWTKVGNKDYCPEHRRNIAKLEMTVTQMDEDHWALDFDNGEPTFIISRGGDGVASQLGHVLGRWYREVVDLPDED